MAKDIKFDIEARDGIKTGCGCPGQCRKSYLGAKGKECDHQQIIWSTNGDQRWCNCSQGN